MKTLKIGKKLIMAVLASLSACCILAGVKSADTAFAANASGESASETVATTIAFTETKVNVSKTGDKMLIATAINNAEYLQNVSALGYTIDGYTVTADDFTETSKYYSSVTLGTTTQTAKEIFGDAADEDSKLLIWEVAYKAGSTYKITAYATIGNNESTVNGTLKEYACVKLDPTVTAPTANTLAYTGEAQALVSAGSAVGGTIQYKLNDGEYGETIPTATNAGTYTVYYKVVGDSNHNDVAEASVEVKIEKNSVTVESNPTAKVNLIYSGEGQNLITAGSVTNGTFNYSIDNGETWTAAIPQGSAAGDYTVKVKVVGNENYADKTDFDDVIVTIYLQVSFGNVETVIDPVLVKTNETIEAPKEPTRTNYKFDGWYNGNAAFNFETAITDNIALTAKWLKVLVVDSESSVTNATVVENAITKVEAVGGVHENANGAASISFAASGETEHLITLPKIDYRLYSQVKSLLILGVGNSSYTFKYTDDTTIATTSKTSWHWFEIVKSGSDYKFSVYHADKGSGDTYVTLSRDIVTGTTALQFKLVLTEGKYDNIKIYKSGNEQTDNIQGTKIAEYQYVDYVAKANEIISTLPETPAVSDAEYAQFVSYLTYVSYFTNMEKSGITEAEKAKVATYKTAYSAKRAIFTPTSENIKDIKVTGGNDGSSHQTASYEWANDKDNNHFTTANVYNFGANYTAGTNRDITLTLPKLNYALYSDVRMAVYVQNTNSTFQSLTLNGQTCPMNSVGSTIYVIYIDGVNNKFTICYNNDGTVKAEGTLTEVVLNGEEGLTLTITSDGWTQVQFHEIYGTLAQ